MSLKSKKGFTLIELIIVIAILGIIALIAVPNLAGIRQRSQVSADKRTAEQIGKAVRIWVTDTDAGTRTLPAYNASGVAYETLDGLCPTYISSGFPAKSYAAATNANYYVGTWDAASGSNNGASQKICVYIGTSAPAGGGATEPAVNYDGKASTPQLAYVEH